MYRPTTASFRVSDMILEKNMGLPILQVESGQFSPTPDICIAVLHSRKLVVVILKNEGKLQEIKRLTFHTYRNNTVFRTFGTY